MREFAAWARRRFSSPVAQVPLQARLSDESDAPVNEERRSVISALLG